MTATIGFHAPGTRPGADGDVSRDLQLAPECVLRGLVCSGLVESADLVARERELDGLVGVQDLALVLGLSVVDCDDRLALALTLLRSTERLPPDNSNSCPYSPRTWSIPL